MFYYWLKFQQPLLPSLKRLFSPARCQCDKSMHVQIFTKYTEIAEQQNYYRYFPVISFR